MYLSHPPPPKTLGLYYNTRENSKEAIQLENKLT